MDVIRVPITDWINIQWQGCKKQRKFQKKNINNKRVEIEPESVLDDKASGPYESPQTQYDFPVLLF